MDHGRALPRRGPKKSLLFDPPRAQAGRLGLRATFLRWKLYGEESLAGSEAALWLAAESLTLEHAGESLSRYEADYEAKSGKPLAVRSPTLFENSHRRSLLPQPR